MRALGYAVAEAAASLWRGRQAGLLSTATIAIALFMLGGFLIVTVNLERLGAEWASAAEMSVYLQDEITSGERQAIEAALAPGEVVIAREFLAKADALARFKQTFGELAATIDTLGDNPLPASYEIRLRAGEAARAGVERLGTRLRQMPGVADVRYDRQWLDRLLSVIALIRGVGFVLGAILTAAAALTVAAVVRLAFDRRLDEIEIMRLVGAPQTFIRGPFIMEGVLQGGIGALAALGGLAVTFFALRGAYLIPLATAVNLPSIRFLTAEVSLLLVLGGMAVGCAGGVVAAWSR